MKKIVIKVTINCQTCQTTLLKAVTKLSGISEVAVDAKKELLTVVGEADPVKVVKKLRKMGKPADVVSVGPPKEDKEKDKTPFCILPPCCNDCQLVGVGSFDSYHGRFCNIM